MARFVIACLILLQLLSVLLIGGCSTTSVPESTRPMRIAAASDLKYALDEILEAYRKQHPESDIQVTYGSSGSLFAQLRNQAPYDMFFSADSEYPTLLAEAGIADADSKFEYAIGHLVLWVRKESPVDIETKGIDAREISRCRKPQSLILPMHLTVVQHKRP